MAITRKQWFDLTVTIDNQPIRLKIKRLSPDEFEVFQFQLKAFGSGRGAPMADPDGQDVTRALIQSHADWLRANADWQLDVFDSYVKVTPGDLFDELENGTRVEVVTGRHFAQVYGGHPILAEVLTRIYSENCLSDDQKKRLSSLFDSGTGSTTTPSPEGAGTRPAPTATPAAPEGSAGDAAATDGLSDTSSGTMPPYASTRVQ